MEFAVLRSGLVKTKKYCPNPIAVNGIPSYADAIANPKVKNTPAYNSWWEEQIGYILNGYHTGGIWVPGRYYKFVNFDTIRGVAGDNMRPELHDFQLDYAYFIEQAKAEHFNIIVPKARRKSVTTMNVGMVIDYGYRFELGYKAGIIAGQQKFADTFVQEWDYTDSKQFTEFRIKKLSKGDDVISGYKVDTPEGKVDRGTMNAIFTRTVFQDPNVMKGKYLNDVVLEESGENEHLVECVNATMDCLMRGDVQYGIMHIYGTGGNMNKGSKGFKKMYFDAIKDNAFNCRPLFVPATIFYFPYYAGAKDPYGNIVEDIPNLQHLSPVQRVGWSDEVRALEVIEKRKQELLNKQDLKEYFDYCQNNPTNIKEVFRKSATNNFPIIKLNDQGFKIESEQTRYGKFRLEFKKDQNGEILIPYEVEAIPANKDVPEHECVLIMHEGHPVKGYRWLDVAGIDSYDQDQSLTSKSLGSMVVLRGQNNIEGTLSWAPVAIIRNRPPRKEVFYDQCMKLAIYYNLIGACLVDIRNGLILQHWKERGCERFLAKRPKKFESPNSKQTNEYGISLNTFSRPRMVGALQSFFFSHLDKVWFSIIIEEALNYDEVEVDSDNDSIDALGIALMQLLSQDQVAVNEGDLLKNDPYAYPEWGEDFEGNVINKAMLNNIKEEPLAPGKYEDFLSKRARAITGEDDSEALGDDDYWK